MTDLTQLLHRLLDRSAFISGFYFLYCFSWCSFFNFPTGTDGHLKLADFGLSKVVTVQQDHSATQHGESTNDELGISLMAYQKVHTYSLHVFQLSFCGLGAFVHEYTQCCSSLFNFLFY